MRLRATICYTAAVAASLARPSLARAADPSTVEWSDDWPRVKWWEVVAALSLAVGDTEFEDLVPLPSHATWTQPILFDSWARSVFRGRTAAIQSFASTSTDIMYMGGALVPFLVDDYFGAAALHRNADVAWQLATIDFQSFGVAGLVSLAAEHSVGRARRPRVSCACTTSTCPCSAGASPTSPPASS